MVYGVGKGQRSSHQILWVLKEHWKIPYTSFYRPWIWDDEGKEIVGLKVHQRLQWILKKLARVSLKISPVSWVGGSCIGPGPCWLKLLVLIYFRPWVEKQWERNEKGHWNIQVCPLHSPVEQAATSLTPTPRRSTRARMSGQGRAGYAPFLSQWPPAPA